MWNPQIMSARALLKSYVVEEICYTVNINIINIY